MLTTDLQKSSIKLKDNENKRKINYSNQKFFQLELQLDNGIITLTR